MPATIQAMAPRNTTAPISPKQIKAIRIKANLSQEEAAAKCGVGARSWFAYEAGTRFPTLAVAILIRQLAK